MKRSQSSYTASAAAGIAAPRRTLFPGNGGNTGWDFKPGGGAGGGGGAGRDFFFDLDRPVRPSAPNAGAASLGRSLLDRPRPVPLDISIPEDLLGDAKFTASAAETPVRRVSTDLTLESCLRSSGSVRGMTNWSRGSSANGFKTAASGAGTKNEEFGMVRNVSFSSIKVREYEVTLGDNPSVSSGAPIGLGWRYDPTESVVKFDDADFGPKKSSSSNDAIHPNRVRRSQSELRLSERERQSRLSSNPNVSAEDLRRVLASVAATRLERKLSLNELRRERQAEARRRQEQHEAALLEERASLRRRRNGIVDGGLSVGLSMMSMSL